MAPAQIEGFEEMAGETKSNEMRAGLMRSSLVLSRAIELFGGIGTAVVGLIVCLHIVVKDVSLQQTVKLSDYAVLFMLVAPGVVVFIGSYVQVMHRKPWAAALVFIGGMLQFYFVILSAGFLFAYTNDVWGKRAVFADLVMLVLTLGGAFINTIVSMIFRNRDARNFVSGV